MLVAVAGAAAALMLATTHRWGLGVTYDSVIYVQASQSLSSIALPQPRDHGGEPLYWWAPGYPLALKVFGSSYSGARVLNALLLFIGVLLVAGIAWRAIGRRAAITAGALYALAPAVFTVHLNLLAEPLYLVLATAALALLAYRRSALAGLAAGAATLTRYAGLPLIIVGAVALRGRDRLKFLAASLTMYLAWLVRNEVVAGQINGRQARWHPPSWVAINGGLHVVLHLFVTAGHLPSLKLPFVGLLVQVIAAAALLVAALRADREKPPTVVTLGLAYAGAYVAFLAITVSLFDASTFLDERLLLPIVPSLVFVIAWLVRDQPIVAATLVCVFAVSALQAARTASLYGIDYSSASWRPARFDRALLPTGDLYSNWPAAVAYFTGRSPQRMPAERDPKTLASNSDFGNEMARLADAVGHGKAALVIFNSEFLEIPSHGTPTTESPAFRTTCRPINTIVTICDRR